jgi:hypothetical protein
MVGNRAERYEFAKVLVDSRLRESKRLTSSAFWYRVRQLGRQPQKQIPLSPFGLRNNG